jgi:hypothetical protein
MAALRKREITPLAFFSTALDGLLWSGDVKPEHHAFCKTYMTLSVGHDEANALADIRDVFGEKNYWRKGDEARTPDDWASYDRIESRFTKRLDEWRRGAK